FVLALMARMEHSNNSWKLYLAMPVEKGKVYVAKLFVGVGIILYSLILLYLGLIFASYFLGLESIPYIWLAKRFSILFVASLAITGLIFYVSYRFNQFIVPILIGAGFAFPSMFIANSEKYWILYPWDYPIVSSLSFVFDMGNKGVFMLIISVSIFLAAVIIGLLRFRTKDVL